MKSDNPVRIVHVITRLILGGAQEDTLLLIEGLLQKPGYDIYLISGPAIGPEGELISRAKELLGDKLIIVPEMRRNINPLADMIAFVRLYFLIRKLKPVIVHTHSSKAGILGRIASKLNGVKIIVHSIYGLPFHPFQSKPVNFLYVTLEKWGAKMSTKLLSIADAMTKQALAAGVGKEGQFQTVRSAIEIDKFINIPDLSGEFKSRYNIKDSDKIIGVLARLAPLKGHEYILKIAPRILEKFPQAKFLFVGDGVLRDQITAEASEKGILDRIIFTGQVKQDVVPHLIRLMDILVHPSLREGLPRVIPEAYLLKKPVISFALDGSVEVVEDGKTGYLVSAKDTEKLYERIEMLLSDTAKAKEMGDRGYLMAKDLFDSRKLSQNVDILYNKLLELKADF